MALRVGIAGYGLAGRVFHAPLLKGVGFDVVGVLTTNPERKASAESDFPGVKVVEGIEQLLELDLNLLVIATPNSVHASQAIAGLKAGIPVVVDKPMGRTLKETEEIIQASKQFNTPVTTFFNRKWDSDALTIKKVISDGVVGKIFRLESRFERFRETINPESWRENQSASEGGGNLLDLQPHLLSTALDWFGPAELVSSSINSIRGGADDDSVLVLKHASGVDSYLSASTVIGAPGPRIRLIGDKGALIISDLDPQESMLRNGLYPKGGVWGESTKSKSFIHRGDEITEYQSVDGNYGQFYIQVKEALSGGSWPVSIDEALNVAKIIDLARQNSIR
jgi:scyllo-inositol 2-dehydrogenase (NADP+)